MLLHYQQQLFPVVERDSLLERYIYFLILLKAVTPALLVLVDAIMGIIQHTTRTVVFYR
jgi:hypothetical protein